MGCGRSIMAILLRTVYIVFNKIYRCSSSLKNLNDVSRRALENWLAILDEVPRQAANKSLNGGGRLFESTYSFRFDVDLHHEISLKLPMVGESSCCEGD